MTPDEKRRAVIRALHRAGLHDLAEDVDDGDVTPAGAVRQLKRSDAPAELVERLDGIVKDTEPPGDPPPADPPPPPAPPAADPPPADPPPADPPPPSAGDPPPADPPPNPPHPKGPEPDEQHFMFRPLRRSRVKEDANQ